ncbi:MAG TPA: nucleotidyltransferase domain-containing protein [Spirochaetes bacterium]|nr:nucleotidyltransferase domain-containing protein [Spirochaetota bacterium]
MKKKKYKIKKACLFGSYAGDVYNDDSDIDIALVIENIEDHFGTQINLMKLRRKYDTRIEPHPFKIEDFNESHPFAFEILKKGIEIR